MNYAELDFLNAIRNILKHGEMSTNRTGIKTIRSFGFSFTFDLEHSFPLLTSRRHSLKWIFEELMWILRGETNVSSLESKGINVWTPNTRKEFIEKQQLDVELKEGDTGKSYGFNMRIYNELKPYDQLQNVIYLLKNDPTSRRIILNLWNPNTIKESVLPPCLCWYQFYVRNKMYLDCQAMNRSSDIVVAGGWNIATASLLTYILAKTCNYIPGKLIWITGDTHIYENNINAAEELVIREPCAFPTLEITKDINTLQDVINLTFSDLKMQNYNPVNPQIKLCMNA
jgi:thymidylate synthase